MKVAHIIPWRYTSLEIPSAYHMALGQWLVKHPEYRAFYRRLIELGHFVIVDNGAAEPESERVPFREIADIARQIKADEVVLPDAQYDSAQTIVAACDSHIQASVPECRRVVIPHGKDWDDWEYCLVELHHRVEFATVGIPKYLERFKGGRHKALNILMKHGLIFKYNVHLFGVWNNPIDEIDQYASTAYIRGIDTGAAAAWAQANQLVINDVRRYSMDEHMPCPNALFLHNATKLQETANGNPRSRQTADDSN